MDILDIMASLGGGSRSTTPACHKLESWQQPPNTHQSRPAISPVTPSILPTPSITVIIPILNLHPPPLRRSARGGTASPILRWDLEAKTRPVTAPGTSGRKGHKLDSRTWRQGGHWFGGDDTGRFQMRGQVDRQSSRLGQTWVFVV